MGKTYDLAKEDVKDVSKDVTERLSDYMGAAIPVDVVCPSEKEVNITIHRQYAEAEMIKMESDCVFEQDMFMVTGEGYKGFVPEHHLTFAHFPNMHIYEAIEDVTSVYKANARRYASRVKDVEFETTETEIKVRLKF